MYDVFCAGERLARARKDAEIKNVTGKCMVGDKRKAGREPQQHRTGKSSLQNYVDQIFRKGKRAQNL
jgi:hypothetical protein